MSVFLFEITAAAGVDNCLWVVCGDLPSAYLVTDAARTAVDALKVYCDLMDAWVAAVRRGEGLNEVFPIAAEPNEGNANLLERRISLLRQEIIPTFA